MSSDRDALLALYRSARGVRWTRWWNIEADAELSAEEAELSAEENWPGTFFYHARVEQLELDDNNLQGYIPKELGDLDKLERLTLSDNILIGPIPTTLGNLTALTLLDLAKNGLEGPIPRELGNLTALEKLSLEENRLTGPIPRELGNLTALESLSLNENRLTGPIPRELGNLAVLTVLNLTENALTGSIPEELGDLRCLEELSLDNNKLAGCIPPRLGNLVSLGALDLEGNCLTGFIPQELGDLRELEFLRLNNNKLTGPVPIELGKLTATRILHLRGNDLEGPLPKELESLSNLDSTVPSAMALADRAVLVALFLSTDGGSWTQNRRWNTDAELSRWFGLQVNDEGGATHLCLEENNLEGPLPRELGSLTALTCLDLSGNGLTGPIPEEVGDLGYLKLLKLDSNELTGSIPRALGNLTALDELHLDGNVLTGPIPEELGGLGQLQRLYLHNNKLTGPIPREFGSLKALGILSLSSNDLTGCLPEELGNLGQVEGIYLHSNKLAGPIPPELGKLAALKELYLHKNQLSGPIPGKLGDLGQLKELLLSRNKLTGFIPKELGRLGELRELSLEWNKLTGEIPRELGKLTSLQTVNLTFNGFTGPIPQEVQDLSKRWDETFDDSRLDPEYGLYSVEYADGNKISNVATASDRAALVALFHSTGRSKLGYLKLDQWNTRSKISEWHGVRVNVWDRVIHLDLHDRYLPGSMPKKLGDLGKLEELRLDNTGLIGQIPSELGKLTALRVLRLEKNNLTGVIPEELADLTMLRELVLSHNNLTGPIPAKLGELRQLKTLHLQGNFVSVPPSLLNDPRRTRVISFWRSKKGGFRFPVTDEGAPVPDWEATSGVAAPLCLGYLDLTTDVLAAVSYYRAHRMWYFALGLVFIVGPALFASAYVLRSVNWLRRVFVALHLGLLTEALYSLTSESYSEVLVSLRVVEPLFESIPQSMLQLYILLLEWDKVAQAPSWSVFSIAVSGLSLAYATTGLVAEHPLSQLPPSTEQQGAGYSDDEHPPPATAPASTEEGARCAWRPRRPRLTRFFFATVPEDGRIAGYSSTASGWHPQRFVWVFLVYQWLEIGARFVSLALLALLLRGYFFLVLLWFWGSRSLILRNSLGDGEEALSFRMYVRLVGMPFMDSIMDSLESYDAGCALTTVEFAVCVAIGHMFSTDETGQAPDGVRRAWTYVAVVCMAGKLVLGFLVVRPFKRNVGFGFGRGPEGQRRGGGQQSTGDVQQRRGSRRGVIRFPRSKGSTVDELEGPERRPSARGYR